MTAGSYGSVSYGGNAEMANQEIQIINFTEDESNTVWQHDVPRHGIISGFQEKFSIG